MEKVYHSRIRKISSLNAVILAFTLSVLLAACSAGTGGYTATTGGGSPPPPDQGGNPPSPQDTTPPAITITAPTTAGPSYDTTNASVTVSGAATDNAGLTRISWSNSNGGSGSQPVSGTNANASFNIALLSGSNVITLTALDTSGNTGQTQITVNYTPPTSNSATLSWDAVSGPTLSGYRVYYGTSPGSYNQPSGQGISVGNTTTYTVMGLSNGTRYYFAVTSVNTSNVESTYSTEVSKAIP